MLYHPEGPGQPNLRSLMVKNYGDTDPVHQDARVACVENNAEANKFLTSPSTEASRGFNKPDGQHTSDLVLDGNEDEQLQGLINDHDLHIGSEAEATYGEGEESLFEEDAEDYEKAVATAVLRSPTTEKQRSSKAEAAASTSIISTPAASNISNAPTHNLSDRTSTTLPNFMNEPGVRVSGGVARVMGTATDDPVFLEQFYQRSRLHYLSTWGEIQGKQMGMCDLLYTLLEACCLLASSFSPSI